MARFLPVARREYLERVRTKAFVIGTILAPLLMSALMILPATMAQRQRGKALRIAVVDVGGSLKPAIEHALARAREGDQTRFLIEPIGEGEPESARSRLVRAVVEGRLDGFLVLPEHALERSAAEYYGKNVTNRGDIRLLDRVVEEVLIGARLASAGLDADRVRKLTRPLDLKTIRVSERGEREDRGMTTFLFSTTMMMLLYVSVLMWGQAVMTGVIEEKANRVVELTISAMPPLQLFAGKLLGVGSAGLTQLGVWVVSISLVSLFGTPMLAASDMPMPEITPLILFSFPVFFLLGYFLYAAMYAAIGAAVNTIQEAQNLVFPVMMPLVVSVMFFPVVIQNPESPLSIGLSLIPFASPLLMFLRITVLAPPWWQIALSIAITLATIAFVTWASARVYRIGILMYGKRPTFPEILRWVRHA
jgi:ABC-2 type transport system permease protein